MQMASTLATQILMKKCTTRIAVAVVAAMLSTTTASAAFADVPGADEGRNAAIAAVESAAAAKRAALEAQKRAAQPAAATAPRADSNSQSSGN